MEIGRNLDEIESTVIALQTHDKNQVLTSANWNPAEDVLGIMLVSHANPAPSRLPDNG